MHLHVLTEATNHGALARRLIAPPCGDVSAIEIAARAGHVASQLSQHVSRIVGDVGIKSLAHRSIAVASQTYPWLAKIGREDDPCSAICVAMERQRPEEATDAFVLVWTTFVDLLDALIGSRLVEHLLHELWPTHVNDIPRRSNID